MASSGIFLKNFKLDKIVYPNISRNFVAYYDKHRYITNQKCFILTGDNLDYLTIFLNSKVNNFYFKTCLGAMLGSTGYEMSKIFVKDIPAPLPTNMQSNKYSLIMNDLQGITLDLTIKKANDLIYNMYDFSYEEIRIIENKI